MTSTNTKITSQKNSATKGLSITKLTIGMLVFAAIVVVLVNSTGTKSIDKEALLKPSKDDLAQENLLEDNDTDKVLEPVIEDNDSKVAGIDSRRVELFLDTNANGIKDADEKACDVCIAKYVVLADALASELPSSDELATIEVQSQGSLSANKLVTKNMLWGAFVDREVLIVPQTIAVNDGSSDVEIPVSEIHYTISAQNSNLDKIINFDSKGNSIIYSFTKLIPTMQTAFNNKNEIWVQFTPDDKNPDIYYLAKGKLSYDLAGEYTGISEQYFLKVDWNFKNPGDLIQKSTNLRFILL